STPPCAPHTPCATHAFPLNAPPPTELHTLSLHDALPIDPQRKTVLLVRQFRIPVYLENGDGMIIEACAGLLDENDPETAIRKERSEEHTSNSSHDQISYAVFCLKKKKKQNHIKHLHNHRE